MTKKIYIVKIRITNEPIIEKKITRKNHSLMTYLCHKYFDLYTFVIFTLFALCVQITVYKISIKNLKNHW